MHRHRLVALLALVTLSCGGERVLHLRGQDATEGQVRAAFAWSRAHEPDAFEQACGAYRGRDVTPELVAASSTRPEAEKLLPGQPGYVQPLVMDGATARWGQEGDVEDKVRMMRIFQEACG